MIDGNHLYQAPASNVVVEQVPSSFVNGTLTVRKLKAGSRLSVLYTVLMFPVIFFSFLSGAKPDDLQYEIVSNAFTLLSTTLWVYLTLLLKSFVNLRFEFSGADRYINITIVFSLVLLVFTLFMDSIGSEQVAVQIAYFALLVPYGIFLALFGWRLRPLSHYRGMKLFAWSNILGGVGVASVVLLLLAIPFGLINGIAMIVVFSAAASELALQSTDR
jgi:hypothetical protein